MKRQLAASIVAATLFTIGSAAAAPPGRDGAFNFRFGGFFPTGNGEFWRANEAAFTLDHSDFNGGIGGAGYTASINNFVEFDVNADFYASTNRSADRFYEDQDGFPILHDTRLTILPVTVGFRVLPAGRYSRRGAAGKHYVRRPVPYLGAGIGMAYWEYEEEGDFVASDLSIVYDRLTDSGLAFEKHAYAGIEFPVSSEWNITLEARHAWLKANPGGAFEAVNPNRLDLGGTSLFLGASRRF